MSKRGLILFLYVLCLLFAPLPAAYGGEIIVTWAGTAGDSLWITPLNWSPVSVPNNGSSNTFAVTIGPPGATGFGEGRPAVREIIAYWSALVPREEIVTRVEVIE